MISATLMEDTVWQTKRAPLASTTLSVHGGRLRGAATIHEHIADPVGSGIDLSIIEV